MVEVTPEEYYQMIQEQQMQQQKPSLFKRILKSTGQEINGFHQFMLRKRAEASARNAMINKMNKRRRKFVVPDYNVLHAHQKVRVGW